MTENSLWVASRVEEGTYSPQVEISYGGKTVIIGASEAVAKAIAILNAASYAEGEVAFFKMLCPDKPKKGFGKPVITVGEASRREDYRKALLLLEVIRRERQPLPAKGVNGIFGFNTQEPLVDLDYEEFRVQIYLDDARNHAACLLQASEAAQFDSFWYQFGIKKLDMSEEEVQAIVLEYRSYKERYSIEAIFNRS